MYRNGGAKHGYQITGVTCTACGCGKNPPWYKTCYHCKADLRQYEVANGCPQLIPPAPPNFSKGGPKGTLKGGKGGKGRGQYAPDATSEKGGGKNFGKYGNFGNYGNYGYGKQYWPGKGWGEWNQRKHQHAH